MVTLLESLPDFREYLQHERKRAKTTWEAYEGDVKRLASIIGNKEVSEVTLADLRHHVRVMSKEGTVSTTIRRRINGLNTYFSWLVLEGHVEKNLSQMLPKPKPEIKQPLWLSDDELRRFLSVDEKFGLEAKILAWFGLRRSELMELDWKDVRLSDKVLIVRAKKTKRDRVMPIPVGALSVLKSYWESLGQPFEGFVFSSRNPVTMQNRFLNHLKACGLEGRGITMHTLRHTFASRLIRSGVSVTVVRDLLGHADVNTTMIYVHHQSEMLISAMEKNFA